MCTQRKVWIHKIRAVRLVACRMQCLYRLHVSHRRAIVFRMMHEYRMSMARRIQHAWFGLMARRDLHEHLEKLQVKRAAAVRIQKIFRGHRAKRHAEHLRRTYVKLQGAMRTFRAMRKLQELRVRPCLSPHFLPLRSARRAVSASRVFSTHANPITCHGLGPVAA